MKRKNIFRHLNNWGSFEITTDYRTFVKLVIDNKTYWNFTDIDSMKLRAKQYEKSIFLKDENIFYGTDIEWALNTLNTVIEKWNGGIYANN